MRGIANSWEIKFFLRKTLSGYPQLNQSKQPSNSFSEAYILRQRNSKQTI